MSEVEVAWVAGLLEGEGSFGLRAYHGTSNGNRGGVRSLGISCGMTDEDTILKLHNIVGIGNFNPERRVKRSETHKPMYIWQVNKRADCVALMETIRPHMSMRRRAKIDELLQYAKDNPIVYNKPTEHGTKLCYRRGCRRAECVQANRDYVNENARKRRKLNGSIENRTN